MTDKIENTLLHFDLSMFCQDTEYRLSTPKGKVVLQRYADHEDKRQEHIQCNAAMGLMAEDQVSRITHFCEDLPLYADRVTMKRVVFDSLDDHPLPEIAIAFFHIPREHIHACHARFYRDMEIAPMPCELGEYGVSEHIYHEAVAGTSAIIPHDLHLSAARIFSPGKTAPTLILNHPELGNISPGVMPYLKNTYLNPLSNADVSALVQYLMRNAPGQGGHGWYNKSWAQWLDPKGSGKMVPAEIDTDISYKGGHKKTDWSKPPGQNYPGMATYELTDEYDPPEGNPANQGVIDAAGPAVKAALLATKNDKKLNGVLWSKQNGVTATTPSRPKTKSNPIQNVRSELNSVEMVAAGSTVKGYTVKEKTSSYGLYVYDLVSDPATKDITLPLKNWPARYLGAYVQFEKHDGTPIKRSDIPNWPSNISDLLGDLVQQSDTKNYLTILPSGSAVFGVPLPFLSQTTDLTFPWPQKATKAQVLLGGLGCANGFKDWDSDVDLVGVLGTSFINYGIGSISLIATVFIVNPILEASKSRAGAEAFFFVVRLIGGEAVIMATKHRGGDMGKALLSKLATMIGSLLFGKFLKYVISAAAKQFVIKFFELSAETAAEITVEEAAEIVPVAGWALKIVSIAADVAALAATTIECVLSPATFDLEILRTMDLQVTVKPDPTHAKKGYAPIWPAVADHYIVQVKYPSGKGGVGGTTYTLAGPMPAQHSDDIVLTFHGLPAGGKVEVVASIYSDTDWLAGTWNSGWVDATPDSNAQMSVSGAIVELLVPLTATTAYSQKQAINYDPTRKHFWEVQHFTLKQDLVPSLDKGGAPGSDIQGAFEDNGNILSSGASIAVVTAMKQWTLTDPSTNAVFDITSRQIVSTDVFTVPLTNKTALDVGGATPATISQLFDTAQFPLPTGSEISVITAGASWTISKTGGLPLYALNASATEIGVAQTSFELVVQNTTQSAAPLPATYPLSTSPTGHGLGALKNIIHNNHEFQLGYSYLASGQNMPIDDQPGATGVPMYAMQSVSTLNQPQEQIYQPTKGFSQPAFLAYDQFGLTPLFALDISLAGKLIHGPVDSAVAAIFSSFGLTLTPGSVVTTTTVNKDWTIGVPGGDPDYQLMIYSHQVKGKPQKSIGVYAYPVPGIDNFFLEPQPAKAGKPLDFYLRGVKLDQPPGEYEFDYSSPANPDVWGIFRNANLFQDVGVHPNGYVIALDNTNAKLFSLKLPAKAMAPADAPIALPLSGKGGREGLIDGPEAMTIAADGRILVLETGTLYIDKPRIQAFDVKGNPVPSFAVGQPNFMITSQSAAIAKDLDQQTASQALQELFQKNFVPSQTPKALQKDNVPTSIGVLDSSAVDTNFISALSKYGLVKPDALPANFKVSVTTASQLWFVTDTSNGAVYDVRQEKDIATGTILLDIYQAAGLSITVKSAGSAWKIEDSVNAMTYDINKNATSPDLKVQLLSSWMPLRQQQVQGTLSYLDLSSETKGYLYVLSVIANGQSAPQFQLDIYNPDGSPLLTKPQEGLNAGKITVDQYRSLYALNFNVVIGPNSRTEPGVSQWIPSTPHPAT